MVLARLRKHDYRAKLKKCEFLQRQLKFLGHLISTDGVSPDPAKLKAVAEWPRPRSLSKLQAFLGTANYLRKHVRGFGLLAAPLSRLTGKAEAANFDWVNWSPETIAAFDAVKQGVAQAALLAHPDLNGAFEVRADASLDGLGAILMQMERPIAFLSRAFSSAERNYTTGEQELLALVSACKEWRCYLESSEPFKLITDHQPLTYLDNIEVLSRRQARWLEFMGRFKYMIVYKPGFENPADPLSRRPVIALMYAILAATTRAQARGVQRNAGVDNTAARDGVPKADARARKPAAKQVQPAKQRAALPPPPGHPTTITVDLHAGYRQDPDFSNPDFTASLSCGDDGLWRLPGTQVVVVPVGPIREKIMSLMHDASWAGHVGITKTLTSVKALFYWQSMRTDVRHYVANCDACQRNKASNMKPAGLCQPLTIPGWRWESVSMDHIVKLPRTANGHDAICVFVDRLSKMVHLAPCTESATCEDFARLFRDTVFKLHGLPREVISDRGVAFNAKFWDCLCNLNHQAVQEYSLPPTK
jgi:hypothetical protein